MINICNQNVITFTFVDEIRHYNESGQYNHGVKFCLLKGKIHSENIYQYAFIDTESNDAIFESSKIFKIRNDILFFDFYALHPIWHHSLKNIHIKNQYINKVFTNVCMSLATNLLKSLKYSIQSESRYVFGNYKYKNHGTYSASRLRFSKRHKINISKPCHNIKILKLAFEDMCMWDLEYGGQNWALACENYMQLENAINNFDLHNISICMDRIFDLFHNTGHILNKTKDFLFLNDIYQESLPSCVLNFRRYASL